MFTDEKNFASTVENFLFFNRTFSDDTLKTYRKVLLDLAKYVGNDLTVVKVETIETFILRKRAKGRKASSCNLYINAIKSFYKWLSCRINTADLGRLLNTLPALPPDQRILSMAEYKKVCRKNPADDELACFQFLCHTGLRVSELAGLGPDNLANGFLRIVGKGRRNRSIPLNSTAISIVRKYPDFSFVRRKKRLWMWRTCKKLAASAKIPTFSPHSCRHFFANELYHRGVDMYTISRLLGHADTKVTENVYVHWSEETLKGTTNILEN